MLYFLFLYIDKPNRSIQLLFNKGINVAIPLNYPPNFESIKDSTHQLIIHGHYVGSLFAVDRCAVTPLVKRPIGRPKRFGFHLSSSISKQDEHNNIESSILQQSNSTSVVNGVSADIKDPQLFANIPLFNDQQQLESTAIVTRDTVVVQSPQPGPSLSLFQTLSLLQNKNSEPSVKKVDAETQTFPAPAPAPPVADISQILKLKETIRNPLLPNVPNFSKPPVSNIQLTGLVVAPPRKSPPVSEGTQTDAVIVKSCGFQARPPQVLLRWGEAPPVPVATECKNCGMEFQPPQKLPRMASPDPSASSSNASCSMTATPRKRTGTNIFSSNDIIRGLQISRICRKTAYINLAKNLKLPSYQTICHRLNQVEVNTYILLLVLELGLVPESSLGFF